MAEKGSFQPKLYLQQLQTDAKESFQLKLSNRFQTLGEFTDPDGIFEEITDGILDTAQEVLPVCSKANPTGCLLKPSRQ